MATSTPTPTITVTPTPSKNEDSKPLATLYKDPVPSNTPHLFKNPLVSPTPTPAKLQISLTPIPTKTPEISKSPTPTKPPVYTELPKITETVLLKLSPTPSKLIKEIGAPELKLPFITTLNFITPTPSKLQPSGKIKPQVSATPTSTVLFPTKTPTLPNLNPNKDEFKMIETNEDDAENNEELTVDLTPTPTPSPSFLL